MHEGLVARTTDDIVPKEQMAGELAITSVISTRVRRLQHILSIPSQQQGETRYIPSTVHTKLLTRAMENNSRGAGGKMLSSRYIPSAFVTMVGFPPSIAATAEFVVPKSIPTTYRKEAEYLRGRSKHSHAPHRPSKLSPEEYLFGRRCCQQEDCEMLAGINVQN